MYLPNACARRLWILPFALAVAAILVVMAQTPPRLPARNDQYQRGVRAWESGDLKAARSAFAAAVRANPRDAEAQNAFGQVLLEQGELDSAIAHFRTVTQLRPELAIAHVYLGQALSRINRRPSV